MAKFYLGGGDHLIKTPSLPLDGWVGWVSPGRGRSTATYSANNFIDIEIDKHLQVSAEQGWIDVWVPEQPLLLELGRCYQQGLNLLLHPETRQDWIGIYCLK